MKKELIITLGLAGCFLFIVASGGFCRVEDWRRGGLKNSVLSNIKNGLDKQGHY